MAQLCYYYIHIDYYFAQAVRLFHKVQLNISHFRSQGVSKDIIHEWNILRE